MLTYNLYETVHDIWFQQFGKRGTYLFVKILHSKGEEVFESTKCKVDLPLGSKTNSHWHDQVNFFHLKMANARVTIIKLLVVDVAEISSHVLVIAHNGQVFELWGQHLTNWMLPPKSNIHCLVLQKDIEHYCKTKIISKQINRGIIVLCYVGY